ncbi:MAG TPA: DUF3800 domain-containing protein [Candidatus Angelobacter sp.]|nr:DUF3800 domain-containing protein [Candidatus Angelobacter sp.]
MWIFIDESGSFSWTNKGKSLFCGLNVSDKELPELEKRFAAWKRTVVGQSKAELKGPHLTANQLYSFAYKVLPPTRREIHLTLVGGDTQATEESFVERLRDQAAELFQLSSELCAEHENNKLRETYRQMSGWVRNRSTSNVFWVIALQQAIIETLQHAIVSFAELEHSSEFENIEIAIDESFVRRDEHVEFWREWLRNDLMKNSRQRGVTTIKEWPPDHPFKRKYLVYKGLFDFNDLFRNHTNFRDSKSMIGLQVADICAHIFYRNFRDFPDPRAFDALRPRVVGKNGIVLHTITVTEASLHHDDLANHVGTFDIDEWKRLADERSRISTPPAEATSSTTYPPRS